MLFTYIYVLFPKTHQLTNLFLHAQGRHLRQKQKLARKRRSIHAVVVLLHWTHTHTANLFVSFARGVYNGIYQHER